MKFLTQSDMENIHRQLIKGRAYRQCMANYDGSYVPPISNDDILDCMKHIELIKKLNFIVDKVLDSKRMFDYENDQIVIIDEDTIKEVYNDNRETAKQVHMASQERPLS